MLKRFIVLTGVTLCMALSVNASVVVPDEVDRFHVASLMQTPDQVVAVDTINLVSIKNFENVENVLLSFDNLSESTVAGFGWGPYSKHRTVYITNVKTNLNFAKPAQNQNQNLPFEAG